MTDPTVAPTWTDPQTTPPGHPAAVHVLDWMSRELTHPNAAVGRPGPVCPFVRRAMTHHAVRLAVVTGQPSRASIEAAAHAALPVFEDLLTHDDSADPTVITVYPDLADHHILETAQAAAKSTFVARGHMLGQFYPGCTQSGLWSRDFRPLDAPVPMLVVRAMKSSDLAFLVSESAWVRAYLERFAPNLPARLRTHLADLIVADVDDPDDVTALRVHRLSDLTTRKPLSP